MTRKAGNDDDTDLLEELLEEPLGSELQQEELLDLLLDPGFSSAIVRTSFVPDSIAVFRVCGAGAHAATASMAARAKATFVHIKIIFLVN